MEVVLDEAGVKSRANGVVNEWRLRQLQRVQRSDAVYTSDDAKSSVASSPSRVCPRCLEKESSEGRGRNGRGLSKDSSRDSNIGLAFDSGIDSIENVKNVSFDTVTSSETQSRWTPFLSNHHASIQTDLSGGETSSLAEDSLCTTVTTFGVKEDGGPKITKQHSKATDV
jgi:hypothetical protein